MSEKTSLHFFVFGNYDANLVELPFESLKQTVVEEDVKTAESMYLCVQTNPT